MTSRFSMQPRLVLALLLAAGLTLAPRGTAHAQTSDMTFGVGGQIGDPSGLSFKFYQAPNLSYDLLLAFDLDDDYTFLSGHRLWELTLDEAPARFHYGPGAFIGLDDRERRDGSDAVVGISFRAGINFFIDRFEVFLNLTPRLRVIPATEGELGGGGGLRYYF